MKNIFNKYMAGALLLGATTLGMTSCSLDEYNPSGEGADQVLETPQGMENLVNQMYVYFRSKQFGREDPCFSMEGSADIWQNIATNYDYNFEITRCTGPQEGKGTIKNIWNHCYENINDANAIINRVDNLVGASKEAKDDYEGEARFMRSYCYWILAEFFGDVELRTKETSSAVFTAYRTDRKVIYDDVIIPDARRAAEILPVKPWKGHVGRATRKAAKALLARVLLTRAQYEAAGSAEQKKFYEQARDAALEVINNKAALGIQLYKTYDEIWQAKNNKNNTEFLWVTTFSSNSSLNADSKPNRIYRYFSPALVNKAGIRNGMDTWEYPKEGSFLMPSYYFMKLWQDWDARYDAIFQEAFPENSRRDYKWTQAEANKFKRPDLVGKTIVVGDTALYFTRKSISDQFKQSKTYAVVDINDLYKTENVNSYGGAPVRNYKVEGQTETTQFIANSYPRFMKYRIWDRDPNGTFLLTEASGQMGFADVPMMRYAEMPLIAAECHIALGETGKAAEIINREIRNERVVKPGHSLSEAQVAASDMTIEWIMEERARELCGEWLRWFDVKRVYAPQGKFASTIRGRNPSMTGDDAMEEWHSLRAIPITFLDKLQNAEEFGQNPGHNPYVRE